ncbi:MAG: FtsX-like permease family protein [Aphanocapsa feldmannii 277cV]|uniref:FtsX-like permease family protein n=2 Tax=Aphanocapsa feldmannii TaxID=192050 RepID=A0A524RL83_9CHRO|nr:MAG: FtsX-like permease family protein [Aphanocapsa feldmannii 288cV]TGG90824.1 MAG: FtsX-like permease family protein [Aphanocapsa feldmannii 277cV]TGH22949.1 MAG: FtsX-like permease family protein [Aphanocapsa feldmannii 277cI]
MLPERLLHLWQRRRVPLAWMLLTRQPVRLAVALAGISFAGVLMFLQLGFRDALFEASITIHRLFDADVVLISPRSTSSNAMQAFPRRRLYQAAGWQEVASVAPVRWNFVQWKNPETGKPRSLLALGFDPADSVLLLPELETMQPKLRLGNRVLYDRLSRKEFGPVPEWFEQGREVRAQVGDVEVKVEGLVRMGASFSADGNLITSDRTFAKFRNSRGGVGTTNGSIELGLLRLHPGADAEALVRQMQAVLPPDVRPLTKDQFLAFEQNYWKSSTSIGFIFTLGAAMGVVVGSVIVYQILFSDVSDHLAEYATLKAMGYSHGSLVGVVMREALLLALLGYFPSWVAGLGLYALTRSQTMIPIAMTQAMATTVFCLILGMCTASGLLAMRKLNQADPAEIF